MRAPRPDERLSLLLTACLYLGVARFVAARAAGFSPSLPSSWRGAVHRPAQAAGAEGGGGAGRSILLHVTFRC